MILEGRKEVCYSVYIPKYWKIYVKKNVNVICLPKELQGVQKNSLRNVRAFQDRIGIWKCWFARYFYTV